MANKIAPEEEETVGMSFVSHLVELRERLLKSLYAIAAVFIPLSFFSNQIYTWLAIPLLNHLPQGSSMIATGVASPFLAPLKLTLILSVFLAVPFLLYQLWAFVAPGLYLHERRLVLPLMVSSTLLFYLGVSFAYFVVFPLMFAFFTSISPSGVTIMTDISSYLDFVLAMFLAFGISFEVPIATVLVVKTGIISRESLIDKRPYMIVFAFIIGMVLTPPDVVSQCMLAIPIWLLFELGLILLPFMTTEEDPFPNREED